jgi:hypothetical protein
VACHLVIQQWFVVGTCSKLYLANESMYGIDVCQSPQAPLEVVFDLFTDHVSWNAWAGQGRYRLEREGMELLEIHIICGAHDVRIPVSSAIVPPKPASWEMETVVGGFTKAPAS